MKARERGNQSTSGDSCRLESRKSLMVGMKAGGSWSYLICQSNRATVANLLLLLQGQRAKHQFYRENLDLFIRTLLETTARSKHYKLCSNTIPQCLITRQKTHAGEQRGDPDRHTHTHSHARTHVRACVCVKAE